MTGPNVLYLVMDDQRADFLFAQPFLNGWLPNVGGHEFTQARCNVGLCGPFRTAMYTGQWALHHGEYGNGIPTFDQNDALGKWVQDAGYRTAMIGKYLNGVQGTGSLPGGAVPKPAGWDVWRQLCNENGSGGISAGYHRGFGINDGSGCVKQPDTLSALDWMRDELLAFAGGGSPWFAVVTPSAPHFPFEPEPDDIFLWAEWQGPTLHPLDASKPSWYQAFPELDTELLNGRPWEEAKARTARAMAREATGADRMIQQIVEGLAAAGQLSDTIIMVTSDNGMIYGENRIPWLGVAKNNLGEESLRVPLLCSGPGFQWGTTATNVYGDVDAVATIVAATGATPSLTYQLGSDLRTLQKYGRGDFDERSTFHERSGSSWAFYDGIGNPNGGHDGNGVTAHHGGVRYKLMHWTNGGHPGETGPSAADEYELYDLDADPLELINLANVPAYAAAKAALDAIRLALIASPPS